MADISPPSPWLSVHEVAKHLGDVYDKLGMKDKARDAWKKAVELDEDNLEILRRLRENVEE